MELTLVPLLLPLIQSSFGLSVGELAWVFNSYGIAVAAGVLVGGVLGDTVNTKRVFAGGVLSFAAGSLIVANASSYEMMITGRMLQGFGGGVFSPLIPILLTRAAPERPGKVLIIWGSVAGYTAAFAPLVFSGLFSASTWHLAFVGFAVLSLSALIVVQIASREKEAPVRNRPFQTILELATTARLWLMYGYVFCTYGCITFYLFRIPLWLEQNSFEIFSTGIVLSAMWLSFSAIGTVMRNKVDQPFVRFMLICAPAFIAVGFQLAFFCDHLWCLVLSSVLVGCGFACSNAPSTQLILSFAPKGTRALSASFDITFARLGGVFTVALLAPSPFGSALLATIALSAAGIIFAVLSTRGFTPQTRPQT